MFAGYLRGLLAASVLMVSAFAQAAPIVVTDVAGRQVTLQHPAQRVMLADSRALQALNIIHPDNPLKDIVAWDNALTKKSTDIKKAYEKKFPELNKIPTFDNPYTSDFSVENAVTIKPDLVIFDIGLLSKLQNSGTLNLLEKVNIRSRLILPRLFAAAFLASMPVSMKRQRPWVYQLIAAPSALLFRRHCAQFCPPGLMKLSAWRKAPPLFMCCRCRNCFTPCRLSITALNRLFSC